MRNVADIIRDAKALGATFRVNDRGRVAVNFGDSSAPADLMADLRNHKDELARIYAHTAPGYVPPSQPPVRPASSPLYVPAEPTPDTPVPTVEWSWWTPGETLTGDLVGADTETEYLGDLNDGNRMIPRLVIATFTDGAKGFYVQPADISAFLNAHPRITIIFHSIGFDAFVLDKAMVDAGGSFWPLVDQNRVVCTMEMERLLSLGRVGHAMIFPSLDDLARKYCGVEVVKDATDVDGDLIRHSFGKYLDRPHTDIPADFLHYAAGDTTTVLAIWQAQQKAVDEVRQAARTAYGWPGDDFIDRAWAKYGPLTVWVWVKAALVARIMSDQGVCFDPTRRDDVLATLAADKAEASAELRAAGFYVPYDPVAEATTIPAWEAEALPKKGPAVRTSVMKYLEGREIELLDDGTIDEPFKRTDTGRLCMDREALADWQEKVIDPVLMAFAKYEQAKKWTATYADKMSSERVHPKWNHGLATGRFSCTGAIALQTIPKCVTVPKDRMTLRQCITMGEGFVAMAVDFAQIELVGLAAAMQYQTQYGQGLADVIKAGKDVHAAIAIQMFGNRIGPVSPAERKAVKPVSFGLPGAMGAATLRKVAKTNYKMSLEESRVVDIMEAYKGLAPELHQHLQSNVNPGQRLAQLLGLATPGEGWQLLKVLAGDAVNADGQPMSADDTAPLWAMAQRLKPHLKGKKKQREQLANDIDNATPSLGLARAVKAAVSSEMSVTLTGRVRANCTFASARNNLFQGPTADGAILSLWRLFRIGYRIAMFVHDEIVVAIKDDGKGHHHLDLVSRTMREEMSSVLCGLPVNTEGYISRSFSQRDAFDPSAQAQAVASGKAAPTTVKAPAPRKKRTDQVGKGGRKTWQRKVETGEFDDGDLPF